MTICLFGSPYVLFLLGRLFAILVVSRFSFESGTVVDAGLTLTYFTARSNF